MKRHLFLVILLVGCGGSDDTSRVEDPSADETSVDETSADETSAEDEPPEGAPDEDGGRARAIRIAEAFVRAQGYTDVPPTVPDSEIVHEGIEGSIAMRLNQIEAAAMTASGQGDEWMVIFRYREARYEGRGRAVLIRGDESPRLAHQDVVLSAFQ